MENKEYIVYMHKNLMNNKVYIGLTCQYPPEERWRSGLGYKDQSKFFGAIQKYGWDGFEHIILYDKLTQEEAYKLEIELIEKYDSINNGYNIQSGGEDIGIWAIENMSDEIYQLDIVDYHIIDNYSSISDAARKYNIAATAISNACKNKWTCCGYYWCKVEEYDSSWCPRKNLQIEAIYKLDKETFKIIKKYASITSAARETGLSLSGLYRCDEFYSLGGFCWCKESEWYEGWKPKKRPNTATPVYQIDINTSKIINEWPSIIMASRVLGINKNTIIRVCKGGVRTSGGFGWCKVENWNPKWKIRDEIIKIPFSKPVYQIDKGTLKIVKKYKSATEAGKILGVPNTCISKVACGEATESGGYYWCFVSDYSKNWKPKLKRKTGIEGKKVLQFDKNNMYIKEWNSIKEAAEFYGVSASNISNVCAGRANWSAGFKWKYKK